MRVYTPLAPPGIDGTGVCAGLNDFGADASGCFGSTFKTGRCVDCFASASRAAGVAFLADAKVLPNVEVNGRTVRTWTQNVTLFRLATCASL